MKKFPSQKESALAICHHKSQKNCQVISKSVKNKKKKSRSTEKSIHLSLIAEQDETYMSMFQQFLKVKDLIRKVLKDIPPHLI